MVVLGFWLRTVRWVRTSCPLLMRCASISANMVDQMGVPYGGCSARGEGRGKGRGVGADPSDINRRAPKHRNGAVHDFISTALTGGFPAITYSQIPDFVDQAKPLFPGKISNPLSTINDTDRGMRRSSPL
jgi:hypothetical protein